VIFIRKNCGSPATILVRKYFGKLFSWNGQKLRRKTGLVLLGRTFTEPWNIRLLHAAEQLLFDRFFSSLDTLTNLSRRSPQHYGLVPNFALS